MSTATLGEGVTPDATECGEVGDRERGVSDSKGSCCAAERRLVPSHRHEPMLTPAGRWWRPSAHATLTVRTDDDQPVPVPQPGPRSSRPAVQLGRSGTCQRCWSIGHRCPNPSAWISPLGPSLMSFDPAAVGRGGPSWRHGTGSPLNDCASRLVTRFLGPHGSGSTDARRIRSTARWATPESAGIAS